MARVHLVYVANPQMSPAKRSTTTIKMGPPPIVVMEMGLNSHEDVQWPHHQHVASGSASNGTYSHKEISRDVQSAAKKDGSWKLLALSDRRDRSSRKQHRYREGGVLPHIRPLQSIAEGVSQD